jgi:UDP-N-acetylmuramyl pentapeptide phosphotransferase/UDP-N-acetylglucosamine-1-phosphate transferase
VSVLVGLVVGVLVVRLLVGSTRNLLHVSALERRNIHDRVVYAGSGLYVAVGVLLVEAGRSTLGAFDIGDPARLQPARGLVLFALLGFTLVGLVDDVFGGEDRGFQGHLKALGQGRMTTGVVKIVAGSALALVLAAAAASESTSGLRVVADAALIALAANVANLFDRGPGRTIKLGVLAWIPLAIAAGADDVGVAIAPVIGGFIALLPDDLRERMMLGDTGANALGGVLGLAVVLQCAPATRTAVLAALLALTIASEFVSFSRVIERVPPLRAFDHLGRT